MSKFRSAKRGLFAASLVVMAGVLGLPGAAKADINVGVIVSATGSTAALGIPIKNAMIFMPETIGGEKVNVIFGDDASDPATATNLAKRMVTQDKVDVIIGSSMTGASIAIAGVANENKVPQLSMSPIGLPPGTDAYTFRMPQAVSLMAGAVVEDMKAKGIKKLAFVGFSDAWGDLWINPIKTLGEPAGISLIAEERYGRADTSVTGQVLKLIAAKPDAILVGASGTASALPQVELRKRGYKGPIYQTHGSVSGDFIRIGGEAVEGTILPAGPVNVAAQLPDGAETKKPGMELTAAYEAKYGANSMNQFAGHMFDGIQVLKLAVPEVLKVAKPGTQEFRDALKAELEKGNPYPASHGVFKFSPTDHFGLDERGRVLITVEKGAWKLVK